MDDSSLGAISGEEGGSGRGTGVVEGDVAGEITAGGAGVLEVVGGGGAWVCGTSPL